MRTKTLIEIFKFYDKSNVANYAAGINTADAIKSFKKLNLNMSEKNIRQDTKPFLRVHILENNMMELEWIGITPHHIFCHGIDIIGELCKKEKPIGFFINASTHGGIKPESQQYAGAMTGGYIVETYLKTYPERSEFKQVILVKDIFTKVSISGYLKELGVPAQVTEIQKDAENWVKAII